MVDESPAPHGTEAPVAARRVALFGAASRLRLTDRLPEVIDAERPPAGASAALLVQFGYLGFSARTGELRSLTALHLLIEAAVTGAAVPAWARRDGRFVDPLRPWVEPDGLDSAEDVAALQAHHLAAVRHALTNATEVMLVLDGALSGRDAETGAACGFVPDSRFPDSLRARIQPVTPDLDALDATFAALWQGLRRLNPTLRVTLVLAPVTPGETPARSRQQQLIQLRVLVDEWVWRYPDVGYLPLWDVSLAQSCGATEDSASWAQAAALLATPPVARSAEAGDDGADPAAEVPATPRLTRAERRAGKRKAAAATVCEDELLDAFSR